MAKDEENDGSTTFDFDPFAIDAFGEKIEFTEATEFTEGSDFFGTAAHAFGNDFFLQRDVAPAAPSAESKDTFTANSSAPVRGRGGDLNRVDTDYWSYEADISTFNDDENTHHIEI